MQTDQKDILVEYFRTQILTDRKVTVHQHAYPDRLPDRLFTVQDSTDKKTITVQDRFLLFKILPTN